MYLVGIIIIVLFSSNFPQVDIQLTNIKIYYTTRWKMLNPKKHGNIIYDINHKLFVLLSFGSVCIHILCKLFGNSAGLKFAQNVHFL